MPCCGQSARNRQRKRRSRMLQIAGQNTEASQEAGRCDDRRRLDDVAARPGGLLQYGWIMRAREPTGEYLRAPATPATPVGVRPRPGSRFRRGRMISAPSAVEIVSAIYRSVAWVGARGCGVQFRFVLACSP